MNLKRVSVFKMSYFLALFYFVIGLLYAIVFMILGFFMPEMAETATFSLGWYSLIIFSIFAGFAGFILGLVFSLVANLVLKIVKGVELQFGEWVVEKEKDEQKKDVQKKPKEKPEQVKVQQQKQVQQQKPKAQTLPKIQETA